METLISNLNFFVYKQRHIVSLFSQLYYDQVFSSSLTSDSSTAALLCLALPTYPSKCPSSRKPSMIYLLLGFYALPLCSLHSSMIVPIMFMVTMWLNFLPTYQIMTEKIYYEDSLLCLAYTKDSITLKSMNPNPLASNILSLFLYPGIENLLS